MYCGRVTESCVPELNAKRNLHISSQNKITSIYCIIVILKFLSLYHFAKII